MYPLQFIEVNKKYKAYIEKIKNIPITELYITYFHLRFNIYTKMNYFFNLYMQQIFIYIFINMSNEYCG